MSLRARIYNARLRLGWYLLSDPLHNLSERMETVESVLVSDGKLPEGYPEEVMWYPPLGLTPEEPA